MHPTSFLPTCPCRNFREAMDGTAIFQIFFLIFGYNSRTSCSTNKSPDKKCKSFIYFKIQWSTVFYFRSMYNYTTILKKLILAKNEFS